MKQNVNIPCTIEELGRMAPSLLAETPHSGCSAKYTQVRTHEVIETIMAQGWQPFGASEKRALSASRVGFQKHLVRFRHQSDAEIVKGSEFFELLLTNSHDRSSSWELQGGIYRLVCSNGLVIAKSTFASIKLRHVSLTRAEIIAASIQAGTQVARAREKVLQMQSRVLLPQEQLDLANRALEIKYDNTALSPIMAPTLLSTRRVEDQANDLWTTFNVIQENIIRGGQKDPAPRRDMFGREFAASNPVQSLDRQMVVNQELWNAAELMLAE